MAKEPIAVFLGAGASKPLGYPLTSDLLPLILKGLDDGLLFRGINAQDSEDRDQAFLRGELDRLLPGRGAVTAEKLPWVTEVLSLLDYTIEEGKVVHPRQSAADLRRTRTLLERGLFEVLQRKRAPSVEEASLRRRLVAWIRGFGDRPVGLVSTNYDVAVEDGLYQPYPNEVHRRFDFGFDWLDAGTDGRCVHLRPEAPDFRLFKLHGSLNWLRCECCESIYINPYGPIAHQAFREEIDPSNTCDCGHAPLRMHIVAPSLFRTVRDANLLSVWKNALLLLLEASEWVVIGYSFPAEDIAIRSLFARASAGRGRLGAPPKVTVVQLTSAEEARYRVLFPDCDFRTGGLEAFLGAG